jgi:serine/threonine-protein kinase
MQRTAAPDQKFVKPGDLIAGKYRIVRIIGEGGMGVVVEAVHQTLDQRVAIKFHRPQTSASAESIARFLREAKSAAQIKSEHVVRVTDVAVLEDGDPYFVMEYLEGRDLDDLIQVEGPLPIAVGLDYALQVCEALAEAHAVGIVHRDLKPANLFLANRPDGSVIVKLLDFGISKMLPKGAEAELSMTKTRALMGSPLYMAPEQMRSTRRVDHRADIWSLGVLIHEILTGDTPFLGETLPEVCASIAADEPIPLTLKRPDAPLELETVILRCLEKDPDRRFSDVAEFALALAPLAPREAAKSIARIVRIVRGQETPTPLPGTSLRPTRPPLRPSTPFGSVRPTASDAYAGTLSFEPSDQRRSGVAAKLRIRAVAPDRTSSSAQTMATTSPSRERSVVSFGDRKKVSLLCMAAALCVTMTWMLGRSDESAPPTATRASWAESPVAPPAAPPSPRIASRVGLPSTPTSPDPVVPVAPPPKKFTSVSDRPPLAPHSTAHPAYTSRAPQSQLQPKDHPDAGLSPSSSSNAAVPSPSGTAAFGATRD